MNLRLDLFGRECEKLYRTTLEEEVPAGQQASELLLGGMELELVPHVLAITTDAGKRTDVAVGWPEEDGDGVTFDLPDTRENLSIDDCPSLVAWLRLALDLPDESDAFDDWRNDSEENWDSWEALTELYGALLDYEVMAALQRIKTAPPECCSPSVTLGIACHDEEDAVDLEAHCERVREMLQRYPEPTQRELLGACYRASDRVAFWLGG